MILLVDGNMFGVFGAGEIGATELVVQELAHGHLLDKLTIGTAAPYIEPLAVFTLGELPTLDEELLVDVIAAFTQEIQKRHRERIRASQLIRFLAREADGSQHEWAELYETVKAYAAEQGLSPSTYAEASQIVAALISGQNRSHIEQAACKEIAKIFLAERDKRDKEGPDGEQVISAKNITYSRHHSDFMLISEEK